jgi:hypothetical protein
MAASTQEESRAAAIDELKRHLQGFFSDGLVAMVGLGHSAGYGLPTMPTLAEALLQGMPELPEGEESEHWAKVALVLQEGGGLEQALDQVPEESAVVPRVIELTAAAIAGAEAGAIEQICAEPEIYPMARLMRQLAFSGTARVITPNYDRLIEIAAEIAGLLVDSGFYGAHHGSFDPQRSHEALCSGVRLRKDKRRVSVAYRPHLRLAKPHGSLDWYRGPDGAFRCPYPLSLPRLMITPGEGKFKAGYRPPFDHHIGLGNEMIDRAKALLAIGFGFNDPHLQTHLDHRIAGGMPTLILTRTLTPKALSIVEAHPAVTALERLGPEGGTRVRRAGTVEEFPEFQIWQLDDFLREVLNE